tara:strand:- start:166 stop:480 length:315 start_codon:yes stop_codon:yes gene_type:complete
MALTEKTVYDKVEVVGQAGWTIQWRRATKIYRDGNFVSQGFHRGVVEPVMSSYDMEKKEWVYTEHDMTAEPFDDAKVKAIATAVWTDDLKTAYKKHVEDTRTPE